MDIFNTLTIFYWFYALLGALLFWHKKSWYVLFPLSSFGIGMYLFLNSSDWFSVSARGLLFTALLALEVVFVKYSIYNSKKPIEEIIDQTLEELRARVG